MNTLARIANPLRRAGTAAVAFPAVAAASARFMASKTVFVGNLSWSARHDDLRRLFEAYGPLESVRLMTERETGRSRGFGFVTFAEDTNADKAMQELDGKDFHGRPLRVNESTSDRRTENNSGSAFGGRPEQGGGSFGGSGLNDKSGGGGFLG
ncbi:hypothetical protein HK097_004664 [Rhizophlyctis rosea]|uniref:RRM domain-containing protein n=1 Tax=Rhizophlyctis rosea TaxID=64517 RepID=A0AAD5SH63_9FUNG|nr:hypothetical protein HK097_004664 [Rhizophlyctis rosea]